MLIQGLETSPLDQALVNPDVILRHAGRPELSLELAAAALAAELTDALHRLHRLVDGFTNEPRRAIGNHLGH
jgi:hypothetical protein